MSTIDLQACMPSDWADATEAVYFLRIALKRAIVTAKVEHPKENVQIRYLDTGYHKFAGVANAVAKSIITEWEE